MRFEGVKKLALMFVCVLLVGGVVGCTSDDDDWSPDSGNITGEWIITITDPATGAVRTANLVLQLTQVGTSVTLTMSPGVSAAYVFPNQASLSGNTLTYIDVDTYPDGSTGTDIMTLTVQSNDLITGTDTYTYQEVGLPAEVSTANVVLTRAIAPGFTGLDGTWTFEYGTSIDYSMALEQGTAAIFAEGNDVGTSTFASIEGSVQGSHVGGQLNVYDAISMTDDYMVFNGTVIDANTMSGTWVNSDDPLVTGTWTATKP